MRKCDIYESDDDIKSVEYILEAQLYRIRKEHLPPSPTAPNFILHPAFTSTDRGDRFLLYDSNNVQAPYAAPSSKVGRLIIYVSDLQLNILSKSKRVSSDGTFETAAQITHQNYIIMGEYEEKYSGTNKLLYGYQKKKKNLIFTILFFYF